MTNALSPITLLSENNTPWLSTSMAEDDDHLLSAAFTDHRLIFVVTLINVIHIFIAVAVTYHFAEAAYTALQYPAPTLSAKAVFAIA